jgi:hypothetical protein
MAESFVEYRLSRLKILVPYMGIAALALIIHVGRLMDGVPLNVGTLVAITLPLVFIGWTGTAGLVRLRLDAEGLEFSTPFSRKRQRWDEMYDFDLATWWIEYKRRDAKGGLIPNIFDASLDQIWAEIDKRRRQHMMPPPG